VLSTEAIRGEVRWLTYRPGWTFDVGEKGFEDPWLRITAVGVPDAQNPGQSIDLGIDSPIPPMADFDQLHRWLIWRLERVESHEAREFFKVNGVTLFDPHRARDRV
jgi:hypothetical protein